MLQYFCQCCFTISQLDYPKYLQCYSTQFFGDMFSWKLPSDPPRLDPGSLACLGDALPDAQREEDPADGQAGRMGGRLIEMENDEVWR